MTEGDMPTNALIERLIGKLSPKGRELLKELDNTDEALVSGRITEEQADAVAEDILGRIAQEAGGDWGTIEEIMRHRAQASEAGIKGAREAQSQSALAMRVFEQAQELDPDTKDDSTLEEAVKVLRRHGEELPEGLDLERVLKAPIAEQQKISHEEARLRFAPSDESAHDDHLMRWMDSHYLNSIRIAAAGVLAATGSLNKAASLLWWAGFRCPAGYYDPNEDEGTAAAEGGEEAELRLFVEREQDLIRRVIGTEAFKLASRGYFY